METKIITADVGHADWFASQIWKYEKQGYTQGQFTCNEITLFIIMNPPRINLTCNLTGVAQ